MMKKTLYLHVGAPKTGTSTIQKRLEASVTVLAESSICYPVDFNKCFTFPHSKFISTGNANPLAYAMRAENHPEQYPDFSLRQVLGKLTELIAGHESVILSHEDLLYASVPFLNGIKDWATSVGFKVKPVLYVRDQISWHVSNYQQHVRQLMSADSLYTIVGRSLNSPDWAKYTDKLSRVFGEEELLVKLYRRSESSDSLSSFLNLLGFQVNSLPEMKIGNSNVGISMPSALVASGFNKHSHDREKLKLLLTLLADCEETKVDFEFPAEVQELLSSYYEVSNSKICDHFLSTSDAHDFKEMMRIQCGGQIESVQSTSVDLATKVISRLV